MKFSSFLRFFDFCKTAIFNLEFSLGAIVWGQQTQLIMLVGYPDYVPSKKNLSPYDGAGVQGHAKMVHFGHFQGHLKFGAIQWG